MRDTGFPRADAENDFQRARRRQVLATLAHRLRRQPPGSDQLLRLDEVTGALGWRGERQLGLRTIRLDTIAGTVDSGHDFDRHFRPTSGRVRERWVQLALAARRGAAIPPIEVYRVGGLHFVSDGHHRVSIAAATGQQAIDAYVTEILTAVRPAGPMHLGRPGLPIQNPQRPFRKLFRSIEPGLHHHDISGSDGDRHPTIIDHAGR
jgi:hypothetical protein